MKCVFFFFLFNFARGIFCNETTAPFAVKLTRFVCTCFNDVSKFFGTKKVKISGTACSQT